MIPQIKEVNFGPNTANDYATLHQATVNLSTMGDRTITTQVRIDGDVVPDFTGWELEFRGERFILPTREPQARKDNTTKNSLIDLTFYSWPVYELKRYFFVEMSSTTSGTAIADKYDASLALNLENFVDAFNLVLDHYFNGRIQISLFGQGQGIYSTDPVFFEINYTKLWEVLQKVYEMYNVRWWFDYDSASGIYLIKMGYTADSIDDHDFSYGYKGGLLSFERTVQSDDLVNILLGRGGEKNLPYRYFKRTDPDNPGWTADPDAIPELANIYFDRLHDVNFRWYVRGWMTNPTPNRDRSWEQEGYVYPTYSIDSDSPYYFAYQKGATDTKFNPVEYVKDDESIAAHGEVWGALDDNDDIYPTIQGVDIPNDSPDIGRVDEAVAISQIETDDISAYASAAAVETTIKDMKVSLPGNNVLTHTIYSEPFTIAQGETGNVTYRPFSKETVYPNFVYYDTTRSTLVAEPLSGGSDQPGTASYDESTGLYAVSGLPAGTYRLKLNLVLRVDRPAQLATGTFGIENVVLTTSAANTNAWKPTFDIWVKNIWQTTQGTNESNKDYAERVWGPILGDRLGDEAKIVFSTGAMSISQDYEFVIADYPVPDRTKTLNGVPSEWKITVYKSDAEYQATGLYIPNASSTQPLAGDKFFFVGIDMPFQYVEWAEERLNQYKTDNLEGMSEISPTWTLKLDKVRINSLEDEDYGQKLADRLDAGVMIRTTDPRFTHGDILSLYIQSITWTWNEPSKGNPYIVPDVEVILADKVSAVESPISRLENDVDVISQTYVQSGDVEAVVRRVAGALFLKKTGESDSSSSPTTFSSKVTSRNFRKGGIGGAGWGLYEDNSRKFSQSSPATRADVSDEEETIEPRTVLEVDRLVVREEMEVNNLVINQISARGGREIISAARIETTLVRETDSAYVCYFDQKQNSVANLFQVNDVAYGQVWSADNMELRFYKMLVTAVDVNSITLAKAGRYGSGAPQEGDVIVQYGNTTNARRQYVIIRDVVGGGHDRMLSGLNSVSAEGVEYYYAGVETGDTPRWFVGDREAEYAEYKDGVLNIKGQLSVLKSDGSYQAMSDYIDQINANETNLQNQIDNNIQSWSASASPLPISDGGTVDPTTANYPASQWEDDETRLKHVGDIYTDETSGQSYRYTRLPNDGDFYWMRISDEEAAQALQQANQALQGLAGLNYLKAATNNGTTLVDGGLILSNLIALGKTEEDVFNIYSGINGIMDSNAYGNGIAAWYGGPMTDHEAEPTEALYANSLFRFDGSGYLAGGLLKWGLDNGAAFLTLNGQAVVGGLGGTTLNDIANLLFDVVQYKTGHYAVKLRPNAYYGGNLVTIDGLYAEGWVSAGGVSDQGGGGGGTGYLRDLLDVNASMSPTQGQALVWDDALGKWTAGDVSVDLTPFERIANRVTTVSSSSNHTQYPTAKAVYDIVNTMLSSAMRFQGVTSTALVDGSTTNPVVVDGASYTATRGDVVVRSDVGLEYLWTGAKWQQLGDETSYAKKTVTITGSGYLTGGGNLEAARTIDIAAEVKTKIDNGATAFGYFTDGAANEAIKLRTPRTIWGQNFDGSADVSGAMTGVTSINSLLNFDTTNNRLGIRVGAPAYPLDVDGVIRAEKLIGTATGITETSIEDEEFTFQETPAHDIADGYRIDRIKGKTLAFNQKLNTSKPISNPMAGDISVTVNADGSITLNGSTSGGGSIVFDDMDSSIVGHKAYYSIGRANQYISFSDGYTGSDQGVASYIISPVRLFRMYMTVSAGASFSNETFYPQVIDLTLMFGAGNEPTAEEFEAMFPESYYDYTPGELINNSAEAIETEAADSSWTSRLALGLGSIKVKDSNGNIHEINGLASAGSVYDEIVGGKLIKRIGSVDLGTLTWTKNASQTYDSNLYNYYTLNPGTNAKPYGAIICGKYVNDTSGASSRESIDPYSVRLIGPYLILVESGSYTADTLKASLSGVMLYYELATPVTYELVSPVPLSGRIDGNGTMRVISDGPVAPFRGDITYGCNPGQMGADASSVKSYLDNMLEIKVVNGVPMLHTTLPFYSDSFVSAGGLSGTGGSGSGSALRDLSDVQLPETITTGSALVYNGEKWVQSDAAFVPQTRTVNGLELSSNISLSLGDLSNVNTAGASNGQSLVYYDGEWVPSGSGSGFLPLSGGSMTGTINMQTGSLTSTNTYKFTHTENGSEIFDAYFGANTNGLAAIYARNGIALRPANANNKGLVVTGTDMTYNGATILKAAVNTPGMVQVSVVSSGDLTTLLQIAESNTGISALDGKYRYYPVNISSDNKLYVHIPWYSGSGSGGSGSSVAYVPSLTSGTLIGTLKIDGSSYGLYAPAGGSGSASWGSTSKNTSPLTVGGTTKTVMLAGAATARDSSPTINTGGTTANRYYGVELSNDGKLFVNVPWIEGGGSTGSYLPLAGGTMTGTINSQSVIAKSNNAYDLGSSGKYYANTYTKKIYLDDGVYIYYDSTNRVIRVQGAGIAATGSVNAGGVSNT